MQDERAKTPGNITPDKEDAERDATSKETLSDMEESAGASDDVSDGGDTGSTTPSPDGQFDDSRGGAGGPGNEAGPM